MKNLILIVSLVVLAGTTMSDDLTPYLFMAGGNGGDGGYGWTGITRKQLVEVNDGASSFTDIQSIYDTALVYKPAMTQFLTLYLSPHEPMLYTMSGANPGYSYQQRLDYAASFSALMSSVSWYYYYMWHYMDSLKTLGVTGADPESLVCHLADDSAQIYVKQYELTTRWIKSKNGDGSPTKYSTRRAPYKGYNNTVADTFAYSSGYVWIPNVGNLLMRKASIYAIKRHFVEDTAKSKGGPGNNGRWGGYFYDNYQGTIPVFDSYYDILTTVGGSTSGFDLVEWANFEDSATSSRWWDSTFQLAYDIDTAMAGLDYHGFANSVPCYHDQYGWDALELFGKAQDYVSAVSFEDITTASKAGKYFGWFLTEYDSCRTHHIISNTNFQIEKKYSTTPGDWNYDKSRVCLFYFSLWMIARDSISFFNPFRAWSPYSQYADAPFFFVNFGEFRYNSGDMRDTVATTGTGYYSPSYILMREYDSGDVRFYCRTPYSGCDFTNEYTVTPGGTWYKMEPTTGVFSATPITSFTIRHGEGVVLANEANWSGPNHSQPYGYTYVAPTVPHVFVWPQSISANGIVGGGNPSNQTVAVSNTGAGTMIWTASKSPAHTWYSISPACDTGDGTLTVSFDISGITSSGDYSSNISISCSNADNPLTVIPVSLTVTSVDQAHIVCSPTSFIFNRFENDSTPDSTKLAITNTGAGIMSWTITNSGWWLGVNQSSGTEPESLTTAIVPSPVPVGTYYDTLVVSSETADNSPVYVPVTLIVRTAIPEGDRTKLKIRGLRKRP